MRFRGSRFLAVAVATGAVALAAACGGGGDDEGSASLTEDEFAEQILDVCRDAAVRSEALEEPETRDELLPALEASVALSEQRAAELAEIMPPPELASQYQEFLDIDARQVELLNQGIAGLERGRSSQEILDEAGAEFDRNAARFAEIAQELGVGQCAAGSADSEMSP